MKNEQVLEYFNQLQFSLDKARYEYEQFIKENNQTKQYNNVLPAFLVFILRLRSISKEFYKNFKRESIVDKDIKDVNDNQFKKPYIHK